jgi:hypothetical protein
MVLAIEELKPGMVLKEAVRNHQDQLLLEAGRKITERTIRVFKSWGIRRVAVRAGSPGESAASSLHISGASDALEKKLKDRFAEVLSDPIMVAIMQAVGRQLAARPPGTNVRDARR